MLILPNSIKNNKMCLTSVLQTSEANLSASPTHTRPLQYHRSSSVSLIFLTTVPLLSVVEVPFTFRSFVNFTESPSEKVIPFASFTSIFQVIMICFFGQNISAIMQRALPPPIVSIVGIATGIISVKRSICVFCASVSAS